MKRCFLACFVTLVALLIETDAAVELPVATPASVGLSPARLERIGAAVQRSIDEHRIAGAVTMVVRHGRIAWLDARGSADRETNKPMQADTLFRICSMTKPITSVAVMMLYEEGRFQLEDPVSSYLPEFKNAKVLVTPATGESKLVPATREMTILDLLRHTSGLTYHWNSTLGAIYAKAGAAHGLLQYDGTIADCVKALATAPLLFNPGERWEYSLSVDVLGRLVEVVSGMPLDKFFQTRIFAPVGMTDTYFYPPADKVPRLAAAYTYRTGEGLARFPDKPIVEDAFVYSADYPYNGPKKLFSGGGGLCSTAADYARFCQMLLNGGRVGQERLLSRKSVELMSSDHLGKIGPEQGFGLGFGVDGIKAPLNELGSAGQYSWGGFFYTAFTIDPKEDMVTIFMGQLHPTGDLNLMAVFHTLSYQAIDD
jgi:CubicO group peptidase (beta-lactamase class C family)